MDGDDEILDLFLEESAEHLEGIENDLLCIEKDGENVNLEQVNKVFRAMHTIKGGSSFFGLNKIKDLTHVAEGILDKVRNKHLTPTPNIIQSILQAIDLLNELISNPQNISYYDNFNEVCSMNTKGGNNLHDKQKDKWRLKLMQKDFLKINGNAKQPICSKEDIKKTFIDSSTDRTTGKINYFNNKGKRKKYLGVVIK